MKVLSLMLLVCLVSCASKKEKKDIEEKAAQIQVKDPKALGHAIHELISSSATLTAVQKRDLTMILDQNKQLAMELSEKSYKFRALLIEELISGKATPKRIRLIKADIKAIERQRLKNTFDTVEKISQIVSSHPDREKFSDHLIQYERAVR